MKNKHTLGTWNFVANKDGEAKIGIGFFDTSESCFSDYNIASSYGFCDVEEGLANARLISSAPEMYEAIKEFIVACNKVSLFDNNDKYKEFGHAALLAMIAFDKASGGL